MRYCGVTMTKHEGSLKQAVRKAKGGGGLSWPRVLGTALAAVTMTLLSARLTSVFGSLMLVAILSVGSAIASEFYRVVITLTAEGTKKVVEEAGLVKIEDDETPAGDPPDNKAVKEDAKEAGEAAEEAVEEAAYGSGKPHQLTALALIFGVVSLITVGVAYAVARAQGGDIYQNTFETSQVVQLSDTEKQELAEETATLLTTDHPEIWKLPASVESLQTENEELSQQVQDLSEANQELGEQLGELQKQLDALLDERDPETPETPENLSGTEQPTDKP